VAKLISPIVNYFLANNMSMDYTAPEGVMVKQVTIRNVSPNYQQSTYFPPDSQLNGENATIVAIEVVGETELSKLQNGGTVTPASAINYGVLSVCRSDNSLIAELPLYGLQRTPNNGKLQWTYFNDQYWQNCYVQFMTAGDKKTLTFNVYYIPKGQNSVS